MRKTLEKFIQAANPDTSRLQDFVENLSDTPQIAKADFNNCNIAYSLYLNGRTALAAVETNASALAHMFVGRFDTHNEHDEKHVPLLMDFFHVIDGIIREAGRRGLSDRLVIIVQSDFGRTNAYNVRGGKDHWSITSALYWGALKFFSGNRVLGATDKNHKAISIDPSTLELNNSGSRIEASHLHHAL